MQVSTTCPYCGVGCGMSVHANAEQTTPLVLASETHPANFGRSCSKGSALGETLDADHTPERLTHPLVNGEVTSWDAASSEIAKRIKQTIAEHGPDSVALYLSGQLLTEDYYMANKLAKGFLGTANVDTNSRLCMSSAVAAYKRAFGSDTVPCCYEDLELADLIVLIGSNTAWTHPVLYQRIVAAKESNPDMKVVLIDPRKTATADLADLHLPITPSSDNFLFQGLMQYLHQHDYCDQDYISQHTEGFEQVLATIADKSVDTVSQLCGVDKADLEQFFKWFAKTRKTISFYSQGINQSATGTDKCNSIINCHLATGKIGYEGAGPFSITGQPNAMGGREVGGLANMLAAHMDFTAEAIDRVGRFWQAPNMATKPGLKAVDLFDAIEQGKVKLLWVMATNPAVSLPDSAKVAEALTKCDTVIVSDITQTDTTAYADIVLPALGWGEKDGTVTNSERRISRQRGFQQPVGEAKADWWALAQVGQKLGYKDEFNHATAADVFREHAQLSAFENDGQRDFDLSALASINENDYQELAPIQWPVNAENPSGTVRMFTDGRFFTPSGKAQFVASNATFANAVAKSQKQGQLLLNTGRLRDQWHTMTRTGSAPRLTAHDDVAYLQVHPEDALNKGLKHNAMARVDNEHGETVLQVKVSDSVLVGRVFAPIHWNQMFASAAVVNQLVPPIVDPVSGQPELKAASVTVQPALQKFWARVVSAQPLKNLEQFDYWSVNKFAKGYVTLVGYDSELNWRDVLAVAEQDDVLTFSNPIENSNSLIACGEDSIAAVVFQHACVSKLPSRTWMAEVFEQQNLNDAVKLLRGEQGIADELICACFGTTRKNIDQAIEEGASSQLDLANTFGCGSKCGSCKPELNSFFT